LTLALLASLVVVLSAQGPDAIIVGKVTSNKVLWQTNRFGDRLIVTESTVSVVRTIRGQVPATLIIRIPGGTLDGVTLSTSHRPRLTVGQQRTLPLKKLPDGSYEYWPERTR
jgi:hypothetical protein